MFLSEDLKENLLIFSNNISYYYIFCVIISLVAVFVACFCQRTLSDVEPKTEEECFLDGLENTDEEKSGLSISDDGSADSAEVTNSSPENGSPIEAGNSSPENGSPVEAGNSSPDNSSPMNNGTGSSSVGTSADSVGTSADSSANSVVTTEREMLIDSIASKMSAEELLTEREIERQQLEEIFKLVNDQKDLFKIDSVEDLEDQMRLYR